jgi:hypothetical protein
MPNRCATIEELLVAAPEFLQAGEKSDGTLTVASQPAPGDTLTLATRFGVPIVTETYVADTDFAIGANETETATNIATALSAGALLAATSTGPVVSVLSQATGPVGSLALTSSDVAMVWNESPMTPGTAIVDLFLSCACQQINLDCWGDKADCAHIFLTAHFLAMGGYGSGEKGVVTSKKIDKLAISYAAGAPSDSDLGNTRWGRMYTQIRKTLLILPIAGRGYVWL